MMDLSVADGELALLGLGNRIHTAQRQLRHSSVTMCRLRQGADTGYSGMSFWVGNLPGYQIVPLILDFSGHTSGGEFGREQTGDASVSEDVNVKGQPNEKAAGYAEKRPVSNQLSE